MGMFNYFTTISLLLYQVAATSTPTAQTLNGTYSGLYSQSFNQDFFLGIPYLQAPVGNRRFHPADSLTSAWNGTVAATSYAPSCVGYDTSVDVSEMAEDCLYLNVIRPHAVSDSAKLPVVVFLHGGGFWGGSASESRYNLSYIVDQSTKLGQPILAISFNYRLSAWGFMYSNEVRDTGATNIGLRDQRFALAWIQENIAGFGGDPAKVTLWGQDAGASSIGFQITAYEGRNDSLLRAAIMESGNPTPIQGLNGTQYYQPMYDAIVQRVSPSAAYAAENGMSGSNTCFEATDRMNCLRNVSFSDINEAINSTNPRGWFPVIDGNIVTQQASRSLFTKKYLGVPIILGANTDEGSFYMPDSKITTDAEFVDLITNPQSYNVAPGIALPKVLVNQLAKAYSNVSSSPYIKAKIYQSDATINANRRQACQVYAKAGIPTYCYRFNVPVSGHFTAQHGDELPYVFNNAQSYVSDKSRAQLATDMTSSWVSFIATLDPNAWKNKTNASASSVTPTWPRYVYGNAREMVFDEDGKSHVESDNWRVTQVSLINGPSGIAVAYQR